MLVVKFGDLSLRPRFHGQGAILRKYCRRDKLADIKEISNEKLDLITTKNFNKLFFN